MFACLLLPRFRLQAAQRWREGRDRLVLVDEQDIVIELNAAALALGISPGMTSAQALARDPRVGILTPSPVQEQCLNDLLAGFALSLSVESELTAPGVCLIDFRRRSAPPCWQAFGDECVRRFATENLTARLAVASTPDLAFLAAHGRDAVSVVYDASSFAAALPVQALAPSAELRTLLADWGIRTIGELLALPRQDVRERLGTEGVALLRKVSGRHKRPLRLLRETPRYLEGFDFDYTVETSEPLLFLLRRFLENLTGRLRALHLVAESLFLTILLENRTAHERRFAVLAPTTEVAVLYRILDTYLETLRLEQRPIGVRLALQPAAPRRDQLGLFESAIRDLNGFGETLARLKALLGPDRVGVPRQLNSHHPEHFTLDDHFPPAPETALPVMRGLPLRRFRPAPPARVSVNAAGCPILAQWPGGGGEITETAGPFRLSGQWWDVEKWATEEWDVALAEGGLYRLACRSRAWRVEGSYDELR